MKITRQNRKLAVELRILGISKGGIHRTQQKLKHIRTVYDKFKLKPRTKDEESYYTALRSLIWYGMMLFVERQRLKESKATVSYMRMSLYMVTLYFNQF